MRACDNPFRTGRVLSIRYRLLEGTWDGLLSRLAAYDHRAAIVGPEGSGKTTLLEDLAPRLQARGFAPRELRLDDRTPRFEPAFLKRLSDEVGPRDALLLDGAEQMGWWAWRRFVRGTRRAGALVVTSHRPGLLPTLLRCRTTPALLGEIAAELAGGPVDGVAGLFARHGGNVRLALRELYDVHAEREAAIG
jgi:hypothetical protein